VTDSLDLRVRRLGPGDRGWLERQLTRLWGSATIVSRGQAHEASGLTALVGERGDEVIGLATFAVTSGECELVTLDAFEPGQGVGSALLAAVADEARLRGCRRLWLITTNDNLRAVGFYQRRGLRLVAVHVGAADAARVLKPTIPEIGESGIPIHDELELELELR
jgi:ribosomal protein S18 acetylase RimI-like enzyme